MKHVSEIMNKITQQSSKAKFYRWNKDIFLRYFDNENHYEALIIAGNFQKLEKIISDGKKDLTM